MRKAAPYPLSTSPHLEAHHAGSHFSLLQHLQELSYSWPYRTELDSFPCFFFTLLIVMSQPRPIPYCTVISFSLPIVPTGLELSDHEACMFGFHRYTLSPEQGIWPLGNPLFAPSSLPWQHWVPFLTTLLSALSSLIFHSQNYYCPFSVYQVGAILTLQPMVWLNL